MNNKIAVLGDGSWATAIVKILMDNGHNINWHIRLKDDIDYIKKHRKNPNYLRGVELHLDTIELSNSIQSTIEGCDTVLVVIPSAYLETSLENLPLDSFNGKFIISAVKGIVPEHYTTALEFIKNKFKLKDEQFGVISGPSHAEEIAFERLTYLTASAFNIEKAEYLAKLFANSYVKTITSDDVYGTEYSAIMKNIMAVASGIAHGVGYGDNFQAVLVSNAMQEAEKLIDAINPIHRDVLSSAYLGDLLVTAYSQFSRNRNFGFMIGKGYSVKTAQLEMNMVAEGYYATKSFMEMNKKFNVDIPIVHAVYNVLYEKISPVIEMKILAEKLK